MVNTSYILNAIERFSEGKLEGSHAQGVFNEAAKQYEEIIKLKFINTTEVNKINFDQVLRPKIKGNPSMNKLTLGMLIHSFKLIDWEKLNFFSGLFRDDINDEEIFIKMSKINDFWVNKIKHGSGFSNREAIIHLKSMIITLEAFEH